MDIAYIAIIHPYAAYDLKTCREFIEAHKYADPETMYRGEIGKLGNIRFVETSEAKKSLRRERVKGQVWRFWRKE